jgi:integrase
MRRRGVEAQVATEPDPWTAEEMRRILGWLRSRRFGFAPLPGSMGVRRLVHPPFHAYAHTLFTTGPRPSEASGLWWRHVDLTRGLLYVRQAYHLRGYGPPKTRSAPFKRGVCVMSDMGNYVNQPARTRS